MQQCTGLNLTFPYSMVNPGRPVAQMMSFDHVLSWLTLVSDRHRGRATEWPLEFSLMDSYGMKVWRVWSFISLGCFPGMHSDCFQHPMQILLLGGYPTVDPNKWPQLGPENRPTELGNLHALTSQPSVSLSSATVRGPEEAGKQ